MAAQAPLPGMQRWLASLTDAPCVLEIYSTRHFGREARLRFPIADFWAPSFRVVSGEPAQACPDILRRVHAITGHIDHQYGCSGTLVALDDLRTLRELIDAREVMNFDGLAELVETQPDLGSCVGFYEADGDWLCVDPEGRTFWTGGEWLDDMVVPTTLDLPAQLDRYFEALLARQPFRPDTDLG